MPFSSIPSAFTWVQAVTIVTTWLASLSSISLSLLPTPSPTPPSDLSFKVQLCHSLSCCLVIKSCPTLQSSGLKPTSLLCPWGFSGKNTGVGCHFHLQGIFLTQRSILCLLHCRQILHHWATREVHVIPLSKPFTISYHLQKHLSVQGSQDCDLALEAPDPTHN